MESSSSGPSYFYEDEVYRVTKHGIEFGIVTKNCDMHSSDEEDDDDMSFQDQVPRGHVEVKWYPKSNQEVVQEAKVYLSDRSMMPGDVVRKLIAGQDTQRGYCRIVTVYCDVQILGSKKVIMGVPTSSLKPVQKFQLDVAVYLDSWIGLIRDVKYLVTLKFADGSECTTDSNKLLEFYDIRKNLEVYTLSDALYPGQKLRGRMKYLKDSTFKSMSEDLKRAKDKKTVTVVVTDVTPSSLNIQWQWQAPTSNKLEVVCPELKPPPENLSGSDLDRLKCLNLFSSCTVQLSDVHFYSPGPKDVLLDKDEWRKKLKINKTHQPNITSEPNSKQVFEEIENTGDTCDDCDEYLTDTDNTEDKQLNINTISSSDNIVSNNTSVTVNKKLVPKVSTRNLKKKKLKKASRTQPLPKMNIELPVVVEILRTYSYVDVVWQDGNYTEGIRSTDFYPIHYLDEHEFFPGDFVVPAEENNLKKYGVIQRMDHCGRVATVKWFEAYSFGGDRKPKELEESEMSVYDIKDHPDFRFRPGTIVIRIANLDDGQCPAGQIMDNYPDGQVRVWWANDVLTPCWPQDIFRVCEYDSDEGEAWDDDRSDSEDGAEDNSDGNSDSSWETETEEDPNDESTEHYQKIGQLIERIQEALVNTRELIVASSTVSTEEDSYSSPGTVKVGGYNERNLTKKLLLIYKNCQYLDKIMGTKFFDVDDLKKWYKVNEGSGNVSSSVKSRRVMEQITRLFNIPSSASNNNIKPTSPGVESASALVVDGADDAGFILPELCSIILKKLVEAHTEYERKFGGFKNEHVSASQLISDAKKGMEALAECLGKQFLKRHMNKAGCSRMHHEIAYRVVLSAIDDMCNTSSTGNITKGPDSDSKSGQPAQTSSDDTSIHNDKSAECVSTINLRDVNSGSCNFKMVESLHDTHRYRLTSFSPQNHAKFLKTVQKEIALLQESLPEGIIVKGFEDRMDLYSVMITGPEKTPYEDGLFLFDINLPSAYPSVPPLVHYIAFCTDRLNPNLYEEGKVCVSLLGTWNGKGTEVWTSSSSLLQLLVSIQGLILVPEPYYNEAGYEKQRGTQQGAENSRMYNENVIIKLVQSMSRMIVSPPAPFQQEVTQHIKTHGHKMVERYSRWLCLAQEESAAVDSTAHDVPKFPLLPASKGFQLTLSKTIASFKKILNSV